MAVFRSMMSLLFVLFAGLTAAQSVDPTQVPGLKRFDPNRNLGMTSDFDIRSIKVGDNVMSTVANLTQQGGRLHYISGGIRSRQLEISFLQPYQDSQLEQRIEVEFDKDKGFVDQVQLTYLIKSAYLSISPVYEKVVAQALQKYGTPLTLEQVRAVAKTSEVQVRLADFIDGLPKNDTVGDAVKEYLSDKIVTRKTHFKGDEQGNALLITGFKQCYFWQTQDFTEWLSLCAFQPGSGNMKGQGVTLTLRNFMVAHQIEHYSVDDNQGIDIEL